VAKDKIGLTVEQIKQCQLNAAESCFLPDDEKRELIQRVKKGIQKGG